MNKQDWTYKTFEEVFDLQMGRTPDRKDPSLFGGDNIWVSIRDIDGKYIEDSKEHITNEAVIKSGIKLVKKGTVIMSFKLTVGKCAIARKDLYTNEAIMAFNVNKGFILDSSFLYYYLQGYRWSGTNKAVMGLTLNKATISKQKIAIPPLAEQERIVAELDLLSGVIEKKKEQLKAYDQLAQSIFYTMFGDPIDNPKRWETKKLGEIANCTSGGTPSRRVPRFFEGTINWFSAGELNNMYLRDSIEKISQEALDSSNAKLCPANSLFIGMYDTAAFKLGIPIKDSASNQACANVELSNDNVIWLYYSLLLMRDEALKHRHGARQKNLSLRFIKDFYVPVPPLSLQEEFAEKVEAIERQKALVQQSIVETQTMFDCTMDKYFG